MTATCRRVSNAELASLEGALAPSDFSNPFVAHHSPAIQRHLALHDLMRLSTRIPAHAENWAKVGKVLHLDNLWLSKSAKQFLGLLCFVAPDIMQAEQGRTLHPRLKVLFTHASQALGPRHSPGTVLAHLESDPWGAVELMGRMLPPIHRVLRSRSHLVRELKYDAERAERLVSFRASFAAIASRHPTSVVLRLELYRAFDPSDTVAGVWATHETARLFKIWRRRTEKLFGEALVGFESRLQWGEGWQVGMHVMLLIQGSSSGEILVLQSKCTALWHEVAGATAQAVSCKSSSLGIYCRGRRLDAPGDSLSAELNDAALYFSKGGGLICPALAKPR